MGNEGLMITGIYAKDVKMLREVDVTFDADAGVIPITGRNGEGKSSLMDVLPWTIGGKRQVDKMPIRDGEEKAETRILLTPPGHKEPKYVIRRTYTGKDSYLKVESADGELKDAQRLLDELRSDFSFDVMAFARMDPKEKYNAIVDALEIRDVIEPIDIDRQTAYDARRVVNGMISEIEGELKGIDAPEDEPEKVDVSALVEERDQIQTNRKLIDDAQLVIDRLEGEQVSLQLQLQDVTEKLDKANDAIGEIPKADMDRAAEIAEELGKATETNERRAAWDRKQDANERLEEAKLQAEQHNTTIQECDDLKRTIIESSELPVSGLALVDGGVFLNDIPIDQCCSAEITEVSAAVGAAANPVLKVMRVMDGSLLDGDSFARLEAMADENGYQILVEIVADKEPVIDPETSEQVVGEDGEAVWEYPHGLYIEDGGVVAINGEETT